MTTLVLLIFHADKEDMLHEILKEHRITGFTTWGPVYGKGRSSEPRMGTQVWPGENRLLLIGLSETEARTLRKALLPLAQDTSGKGLKVFELTASQWM
jgi:hypothetical protein